MPNFDFNDLLSRRNSEEENKIALAQFSTIAFAHIPHMEIMSILNQNKAFWQDIRVHKGKSGDNFPYPGAILQQASRKRENIIALILTGSPLSAGFFQELNAYADDFSITDAPPLPDDQVIFLLFFINQ